MISVEEFPVSQTGMTIYTLLVSLYTIHGLENEDKSHSCLLFLPSLSFLSPSLAIPSTHYLILIGGADEAFLPKLPLGESQG
jgi:hypothetical protein